ncbi:hypothetical protein ACFPOI_35025 [Nonomuraea angiospora]|uniref:Uncharacterized protein n=1 Tax=Nonomuraea angiospora TaxID=46172 RepID=A0ABR9M895_9ACTN|nr:hypothetical protein [Nonomuraea angiospora]MBE1589129.1 hypothetical protein [Nonomuraea angiospora]
MTVAGVFVLFINDHLLKQTWPGPVTGKLSDVAGLLVAPALVALLFWRRADLAATVLTGVLFTLVKTTETGAELASHVWTLVAGPSRVLADPTDLLALPALALAWWVRRRSLESYSARWRVIVTMPLAVLAVTATSAAPMPSADSVEVDGGSIVVHIGDGIDQVSDDGGVTWSDDDGSRDASRPLQSAACVPMQATRCYRVMPDRIAVEQSDDGGKTWGPSWALTADDRERLARRYPSWARQHSMALAVQPRPGGHVVVVANGLDGIVVRDMSGEWRRVGWPGSPEFSEVDLSPESNVAIFLAVCMLFGGAAAGLQRYQRAYIGFAAAAGLGLFTALNSPAPLAVGVSMETALLSLLGVLATVVGTVVCLVLAVAGRARPTPAAVGVLAAPLVYVTVYTPFYGWSVGTPGPYWVAVALAVLLTGLAVLGGAVLIRYDARRAYLDGSSTSRPT